MSSHDDSKPYSIDESPYHTKTEFMDELRKYQNAISVLSLNIQSLNAKYNELCIFVDELYTKLNCAPSVICLQETWLGPESDATIYSLKNYNMITQDSICSKHSGIAIYVHQDFTVSKLDYYKENNVWEGLFIEICRISSKDKITIGNIYKPPNNLKQRQEKFISDLNVILKHFNNKNKECIIAGDFNLNLLDINRKPIVCNFFDTFITENFLPTITVPTRITASSATLIDNLFKKVTNKNYKTSSGVITTKISDHFPCYTMINLPLKPIYESSNYVTTRTKCFDAGNKLKNI